MIYFHQKSVELVSRLESKVKEYIIKYSISEISLKDRVGGIEKVGISNDRDSRDSSLINSISVNNDDESR